jgi:hypothetical protein
VALVLCCRHRWIVTARTILPDGAADAEIAKRFSGAGKRSFDDAPRSKAGHRMFFAPTILEN